MSDNSGKTCFDVFVINDQSLVDAEIAAAKKKAADEAAAKKKIDDDAAAAKKKIDEDAAKNKSNEEIDDDCEWSIFYNNSLNNIFFKWSYI